jgi:hypothetical protein
MGGKLQERVPLRDAAESIGYSTAGMLKILRKTGRAIRDDGRWFARQADVTAIKTALSVLEKEVP